MRKILLAAGALCALPAYAVNEGESYRYQLELNADAKLCGQMNKVYNGAFQRPWQRAKGAKGNPPVFFYSMNPSPAEFAAVKWREGRSFFSGSSSPQSATLVAELDIDNNGSRDVIVKTQFMKSAGSGTEQLWVLSRKAFDPAKPIDMNRVFGKAR